MNITEFTNTLRKIDRILRKECGNNSEKARVMQTLMQQYAKEEMDRREEAGAGTRGPDMSDVQPSNRLDGQGV